MCRQTQSEMSQLEASIGNNLETQETIDPLNHQTYLNHDPIADRLQLPKPKHITRIYVQNPNGLSVMPGGNLPTEMGHCKEAEADIQIFPESNLDTTKDFVNEKIQRCADKICGRGRHKVIAASSSIAATNSYKRGGVLGVVAGHLHGRVIDMGTDPLGRWVHFRFTGSAERVITFIGTYQVCKGKVNPNEPGRAINQQYSMLEQMKKHQPHRVRNHHVRDLLRFVEERKNEGDLICVAGDFNETIGENGGGLTRLCSDFGLQDPVFELHGCTNFNTHNTGSKCIDYILLDPELMPAVRRCGYEAFNARIVSDHRGLYVDVDTALFFGSATIPMPKLSSRDYCSKHINNTAVYFDHLTAHLEDHTWFDRIAQLKHCIISNCQNDELAENLDRRRIAACLHAGKKLKKYPKPPWSPELIRLRNIHSLMKMIIHQKAHPWEDCTEAIENIERKLGSIGVTIPDTMPECKAFQRENLKVLRATEAQEMRDATARRKHQEDKIKQYTDANNTEAAKILKRIQRAEATSAVFRQCAVARGLDKGGGLSYVQVPEDPDENPKTCKEWKTLTDPTEVETAIRARLEKHFSQSKDCNLTSPPMDLTMDFAAADERANQILSGTYDCTELDDMTTALIECLQTVVGGQPVVSSTLAKDELLGKIKAWNERTSTSPLTGVHLGHAKAYIADTNLAPKSEELLAFETKREAVIEGHLVLLNYALHFGYSYTRWQSIVNAMLEKDPGSPKIHRLRVIHLYEWDFNLLLCVKWRQLLHYISDNRKANAACYGSIPGHASLDPVFVRELELEMMRLTRRMLIHFDNDATSCYDRIPCYLANLASRKYGMDAKVCIVQAQTLKQAKYFLKTKLRISSQYAEHTQECPWFGTGQGSGNSPFYWLVISSTLYDMYCDMTTGGATHTSPDKTETVTIHLLGFVDDVNNRTTLPMLWEDPDDPEAIAVLMNQAILDCQLWRDLLVTVNQALEMTKCKFHLVRWDFKPTGRPFLVESPTPPQPLTIQDSNGASVEIQYIPNSKAIKYLGCLKAPGNQTEQLAAITSKCNDYARVINCSQLSRRGTQVFYQAIYRLSVGYPLPVCYFKFKELDKAQRRAHQAMVSHSGFNKHTARAVLFGPKDLGGAEFFHLYDIQGYGQVSTFLKFWRSPHTQPGSLLRITMAWAQYCVGTGTPILGDNSTSFPHFESNWISSMRIYLGAIDGTLELKDTFIPQLQRESDRFIMDLVLAFGQFKPYQVRMINYCRLFLRVVTVSDIANATGTAIDKGMYRGKASSRIDNENWNYVHQRRPNKTAWSQWKRFCRLITNTNALLLHSRLGAWTVPAAQIRRKWMFWHDRHTQTLYHRQADNSYTSHLKLYADYDQDILEAGVQLTAAAVPVDVAAQTATWRVIANYSQWELPQAPALPPNEVYSYLVELPAWERELFTGLNLIVPQDEIFHILTTETIIIASDGSQQGPKASFGWIFSTAAGYRFITCNGPAYGASPSSYRAEGYGILSVVRFLHHLRVRFNLTIPSCSLLCDSETMVKRSSRLPKHLGDHYPNSTLDSEWDILIEIWSTNAAVDSDSRPIISHIKSHQDKEIPYAQLPLPAQLNVDADKLADAFIADNPDMDYSLVPLLPTSGIQLNLSKGTVTHNLKREIPHARTRPILEDYLMDKFDWTPEQYKSIDLECLRRALNRLRKHRTILIKHLNDIIPIGKRVHRYDPKYPESCPSCPEPVETAPHLHHCDSPSRRKWRVSFLKQLRETMEKIDTPVAIIELMLEGLVAVFEDRDPTTLNVPASVQCIANSQAGIGWDHLLRGRLSEEWSQHIQAHIGPYDPKKNGQTWATTVIQTILTGWLDLWQLRNGDRHGRDQTTKAQAAKAQAVRELELIYDGYLNQIMPHHNWILATPLEQRKNLRTHALRLWINCFKPVLEESYKTRLETG